MTFFPHEKVEALLKLTFINKNLLNQAFVHRSYWNENPTLVAGHNERLEFLGDSILGMLVAEYLFQQHPEMDEGTLSQLRSQLVDAPACATYIQKLGIASFLLLGKGEQQNQGKGRESIHADLFEALIGALYLDQNLAAVRTFFLGHFQEEISQMIAQPLRNWKAELQDLAQKNYQQTPIYKVEKESGPPHLRHFTISVWIMDKKWGEGSGSSKKEAQIEAAKSALTTSPYAKKKS